MRIAIISLKVNANYGGLLQAWALQQVLKRYGHEAELIDTPPAIKLSTFQKSYLYPIRFIKKVLFHSTKPVRYEAMLFKAWETKMSGVLPFINRIRIKNISNISDLDEKEFDTILFGSDQVWRPEYFKPYLGDMRNAFGWFAKDWRYVKIYSYAASFGLDNLSEYSEEELYDIKSALQNFSKVSVRESSGVGLCKMLGTTAEHVLDPTMLLNRADYLQLIDSAHPPVAPRHGIMTYILDPSHFANQIINEAEQATGLSTYSSIAPLGIESYSVEQWIAGFRDADFIVTDSFHACVFSIIFRKPFVVIANKYRGNARIESLLALFGLEHHKIETSIGCANPLSTYSIDNASINKKLAEMRRISFNFLKGIK